ncbi:hypothetical protein HMPREF9087_1226 [Enterococcus casseliflavus ATCC 12755]|uniref:Uncharacterized protein n=1 Tax=Enterococcus casseliflavus ATCC 12755 TaxID=888066 RepID=F0EID8_ENTCA|nr:hypothetical protein HMPREF9087_1226 [Enterococcus casseliflavus ATCC 12755]
MSRKLYLIFSEKTEVSKRSALRFVAAGFFFFTTKFYGYSFLNNLHVFCTTFCNFFIASYEIVELSLA